MCFSCQDLDLDLGTRLYKFLTIFGASNFGHCADVKINVNFTDEYFMGETLPISSTISIGNSKVYCGIWD